MKPGNQMATLIASATATLLVAFLLASSAAAQIGVATASATPAETSTPESGLLSMPSPAATPSASPQNPLDIEVIGLRNDSGEVGCSIFNDAQGFPRDDSKVLHHVWTPIRGGKATCEFTGLAPGQYAAVVFHDQNGDHEFNMNAFGMPKEGYGFSNDAAALFSPPSFQSAAFTYDGKRLYIVINIRY
jgi:uncharacterized protein (DUF2141 family)